MDKIVRSNSNLLDKHYWSEHKGLSNLCNHLWKEYFHNDQLNKENQRHKGKSKPKNVFRNLLINLYIVWLEDEEKSVAVSMTKNSYKVNSRYNAIKISSKIIDMVHKLEKKQLIDTRQGSEQSGRVTRIRATTNLMKQFAAINFCMLENLEPAYTIKELVVLNKKDEDDKKQELEYYDTYQTEKMRAELKSYNKLINESHIDIPTLKQPVITRTFWNPKKQKYQKIPVQITHQHKLLRRIFYRGSFDYGGRLHGAWWQGIGNDYRSQIYINGQPTVEADYSGLHIALLYGLKGQQPPKDPYTLDYNLEGFNKDEQRAVVKGLVLNSINASTEKSAFGAFRQKQSTGTREKKLKNQQLKLLLDTFCNEHPLIKDSICKDKGVELMRLDGEIAIKVVNHFTSLQIPVLTIFDSFIVEADKEEELKNVMKHAVNSSLGFKVNIKLEEGVTTPNHKLKPTLEYKRRLLKHQQWVQQLTL